MSKLDKKLILLKELQGKMDDLPEANRYLKILVVKFGKQRDHEYQRKVYDMLKEFMEKVAIVERIFLKLILCLTLARGQKANKEISQK